MNNEKVIDFCFENSLRLETIIHLGSMCYEYEAFSYESFELFEYHKNIWNVLDISEPEDTDRASVAEYLVDSRKFGFLIKANTPLLTFHSESSASFSWGAYTAEMFYAETFEEAFDKAKQWCLDYYEKQKIEQNKPTAKST